jgi:hypothetical protein
VPTCGSSREAPTVSRAGGQPAIPVSSPATDILSEATYVSKGVFSSRHSPTRTSAARIRRSIHKGHASSIRSAPEHANS